jgi:uncharacterized protein YkwD
MPLPGRGHRTAAALLLTTALSFAGAANASEREDASAAKQQSATFFNRHPSRTANPPATTVNAPSTESLPKTMIEPGSSASGITPFQSVSGVTEPTPDEKLLVQLINVERTSRGLQPVVWDGQLSGLARMHSADMRSMRKAQHASSADGATFGARLARTPFRACAAAENVAYNADVVRAHRALMASEGHRHNILDPELTAIGTAVLTDTKDDWIWVTEDFATPIAHVSDDQAEQVMRKAIEHAHSRIFSLPEDKAMSSHLDKLVEEMIESGTVRDAVGGGVGEGWTLAFTSMDPTAPPPSALERAAKAESYALAVSFRKTAKYPFGAYWAILYFKGVY